MKIRRSPTRTRKARSLEREFAGLAEDVRSLGASLGATASEEAHAAMQAIARRAESLAAQGSATTEGGIDALKDAVRETPLGSLAHALAAGIALGAFMRR